MIVENGKRYVRADGDITGVIEGQDDIIYRHTDPKSGTTYDKYGQEFIGVNRTPFDLVSEYIEPQYGPWIPWAGGECPVAKGTTAQVQLDDQKRVVVEKGSPLPLVNYNWQHEKGQCNIIYYRVLIEEPEAVETVFYLGRKAIVTVQGDSIKAEWAE